MQRERFKPGNGIDVWLEHVSGARAYMTTMTDLPDADEFMRRQAPTLAGENGRYCFIATTPNGQTIHTVRAPELSAG